MNLIMLVVAFLRVAFPFPDFTNGAAVADWLKKVADALGQLISGMVDQFKKTGTIELDLEFSENQDKLKFGAPEAWGDGKFLQILQQLLPIILKILPLFFTVNPTPKPDPVPPSPPVV